MKKLVALALMAMVVLSGCSLISARGGGWMEGADSGKATFGFGIQCNEKSGFLKGAWVYHDKGSDVNIHGKLTDDSGGWDGGIPCDMTFAMDRQGFLKVEYVARPSGDIGTGLVKLVDGDLNGPDKEDWLKVKLLTGADAPYENYKELGGGNLKVETWDS
jgi:hypothetical protein